MEKVIVDKIENSKIIFVDCFDTWLYRLIKPREVLDLWFRLLSTVVGVDSELLRSMWEKVCESSKPNLGFDETSFKKKCDDYYRRLTRLKPLKYDVDDFFKLCTDKMLMIEIQSTIVDTNLISYLKKKKLEGKLLVCITDFYLPLNIMSVLFKEKGVDIFDHIYVSSEVGYRKSSGKLYDYVIHDLGIEYNKADIVMIGDNKKSDISQSKSKGIRAVRYSNENIINEEMRKIYYRAKEIYNRNLRDKDDFSNYVFSLYQFSEKLYSEASKKKVKKLFFLSREGKFLKELFDRYLLINKLSFDTEYVYVSRKSTYLPSLDDIKSESFVALKKQITGCSLRAFFKNISIDENEIPETILNKYNIDCYINNFFYSDTFFDVINNSDFVSLYDKKRSEAKRETLKYFRKVGLMSKEKVGVVDVGWKGTIQDNIIKILDNNDVLGFYYGLNGNIDNIEKKFGLIFTDYPYNSEYYNIYKIQARMLERILAADHGSCEKYIDSNYKLNVFSENDKKLFNNVRITQKNILSLLGDINNIVKDIGNVNPILVERVFAILHTDFVLDINRNRVNMMNILYDATEENFGNFIIGNQKNYDKIKYIKIIIKNPLESIQKLLIVMSRWWGIPIVWLISRFAKEYYVKGLYRSFYPTLLFKLEESK